MDEKELLETAINHCSGKITHLAKYLRIDHQVIQHWRRKGRVPKWRRDKLEALIAEKSANRGSAAV